MVCSGMDWLKTTDFAHRGLHGLSEHCPENSMPAFEEAVDHGYGIEIDIQRSADNEAIAYHDLSLKRLTGKKGLLANMQTRELKKIRYLGTGVRISTLKDLLKFVRGRVPLLLEIKSAPGIPGTLELRVAELVRRYSGPVAMMSWAPATVEAMAILAPGVPAGRVISKYTDPQTPARFQWLQTKVSSVLSPSMQRLGPSSKLRFVACDIKDLLSENSQKTHEKDTPVLAWTITSSQEADRARAVADSIIFEGFKP